MKKIYLFLVLCIGLVACNDEVSYIADNVTNEGSVSNIVNDGDLGFTYKGNFYSSPLTKNDSIAFFSDSQVEKIYKSILENSEVFIYVKKSNLWEIYDNQEEFNERHKEPISTRSFMEPEAYNSFVCFYEHDEMKGKSYCWNAKTDLGYGSRTEVTHLHNSELAGEVSSFYINNTSYNYHLELSFKVYQNGNGNYKKEFRVLVAPRNGLAVPSIRTTYGREKNDGADYIIYTFKTVSPLKNPDAYVLEYMTYLILNTNPITKTQLNLGEKYISNGSSTTVPLVASLSGYVTDEVTFKSFANPKAEFLEPIRIGFPIIVNGSVDVRRLSDYDWIHKLNLKQQKNRVLTEKKTITLGPYRNERVKLACYQYNITLGYKVGFISMDTGKRITIDGTVEAKIHDEPFIAPANLQLRP